jgi:signal transduction histidine kinase
VDDIDGASSRPDRSSTRLLLGIYAAASAALVLFVLAGSLARVGGTFPGFLVLDNGIIAAVYGSDWTGPAAGLPFDGAVVAESAGQPFAGGRALLDQVAVRAPGEVIDYRVRRGGETATFSVPSMRLGARDHAVTFGAYLAIAAVLLTVGGLALGLRPDLPAARALFWAFGSLGALFALAVDHLTSYRLIAAYHVVEALAPAAILNLALVFPRARIEDRRRRVVVAGVALLFLGAASVGSAFFHERPDLAWRLDGAFYLLMAIVGMAMIGSFAESFARGRDPEERARAALVFTGGLVGFLLPAAALFAFFVLGVQVSTLWWTPFLAAFALILLYAIVRHDLLRAERVLRLGVGYVIATTALLFAYAGALALLSRLVWAGAERSPVASFLLVLAVAVSFEPMRKRVQVGIDRLFYRSRVDVARTLEEVSAELAVLETEDDIARRVEGLLDRALDLERISVALGAGFDLDPGAPVQEPIAFRRQRLGLLTCGAKRSGAPFSASERDLIRGVAAQTALALHNARAIRALRVAQAQILRIERLAAVGEFAGAVAHGIRNPLAGIRAAVQVALQRAEEGPLADSLAAVLSEADRLELRIRSLLGFSRPYEPRLRRTDLADLLRAVERSMRAAAEACGVRIEVAAEPLELDVDPDYLEEALLELASNALRAMPGGGSLRLALSARDDAAVVRVSDTGSGVPDGVRPRVFELFFTTRHEGSGVGLPTVKKIVELHGGAVELEQSGPGGSVFRLTLPRRT